jgi:hypothetical protein
MIPWFPLPIYRQGQAGKPGNILNPIGPILPPQKVAAILVSTFLGDYIGDPGSASNDFVQGTRDPLALLLNPGVVGAKYEVAIADTNVATAILRGAKVEEFGLDPGSRVVITPTIYRELLNTEGVNKLGLDKLLQNRGIEVRNVSIEAFKAAVPGVRGLVNLQAISLKNRQLNSTLADYVILTEARVLKLPILTLNTRDFNVTAIGGGLLAERAGVKILSAGKPALPKAGRLSTITRKIFQKLF